MSKLKRIREFQNLTQEELSEKSRVSVRTIQRIESGKQPKGYTLRVLVETLGIEEREILNDSSLIDANDDCNKTAENYETSSINYSYIKWINLSSLPFVFVPLINILVPLLLIFIMKVKHPITKQIISVQIIWTVLAPIVFMTGIFLKLGNQFTLLIIILIILSNIYIILRNAFEIDRNRKLYYKLNFSII
jgi:transcriptional regulator with XRE-family HTH domain